MKKIILTTCLLFALLGHSQIHSGEIIYAMKSTSLIKENDAPSTKKIYSLIQEAANEFEFELLFNKNLSAFKKIENMAVGNAAQDKINRLASIFSKSTAENYKNAITKELLIKKNGYNIIDNNELRWELTNETKRIGDIPTYKAFLKNNTKIIAWYAPSIPFGYGPLGYNSLPGVILEIKTKTSTLTAKKVILNSKKAKRLLWPKDLKTISIENYNKLSSEAYNKFKN